MINTDTQRTIQRSSSWAINYLGSYTVMMDWAECRDYCKYFPHADQLGHQLVFADILDSDTMEYLRYNMNEQYQPGNGYAGYYWAGGYRAEDGHFILSRFLQV